MAGTVLAVVLYKFIKALEYESANPDPELGPAPPTASEGARSERTDFFVQAGSSGLHSPGLSNSSLEGEWYLTSLVLVFK
jgi:hypothetical protein